MQAKAHFLFNITYGVRGPLHNWITDETLERLPRHYQEVAPSFFLKREHEFTRIPKLRGRRYRRGSPKPPDLTIEELFDCSRPRPQHERKGGYGDDGGCGSCEGSCGGSWGDAGSSNFSGFNADAWGSFDSNAAAAFDAAFANPSGGGDWASFNAYNADAFNVTDPNLTQFITLSPSDVAYSQIGGGDWGSSGIYSAAGLNVDPGASNVSAAIGGSPYGDLGSTFGTTGAYSGYSPYASVQGGNLFGEYGGGGGYAPSGGGYAPGGGGRGGGIFTDTGGGRSSVSPGGRASSSAFTSALSGARGTLAAGHLAGPDVMAGARGEKASAQPDSEAPPTEAAEPTSEEYGGGAQISSEGAPQATDTPSGQDVAGDEPAASRSSDVISQTETASRGEGLGALAQSMAQLTQDESQRSDRGDYAPVFGDQRVATTPDFYYSNEAYGPTGPYGNWFSTFADTPTGELSQSISRGWDALVNNPLSVYGNNFLQFDTSMTPQGQKAVNQLWDTVLNNPLSVYGNNFLQFDPSMTLQGQRNVDQLLNTVLNNPLSIYGNQFGKFDLSMTPQGQRSLNQLYDLFVTSNPLVQNPVTQTIAETLTAPAVDPMSETLSDAPTAQNLPTVEVTAPALTAVDPTGETLTGASNVMTAQDQAIMEAGQRAAETTDYNTAANIIANEISGAQVTSEALNQAYNTLDAMAGAQLPAEFVGSIAGDVGNPFAAGPSYFGPGGAFQTVGVEGQPGTQSGQAVLGPPTGPGHLIGGQFFESLYEPGGARTGADNVYTAGSDPALSGAAAAGAAAASGAPPAAQDAARDAAAAAAARGEDPAGQAAAAGKAAEDNGASREQGDAIASKVYDAASNQANLAGPDVAGGRGRADNTYPIGGPPLTSQEVQGVQQWAATAPPATVAQIQQAVYGGIPAVGPPNVTAAPPAAQPPPPAQRGTSPYESYIGAPYAHMPSAPPARGIADIGRGTPNLYEMITGTQRAPVDIPPQQHVFTPAAPPEGFRGTVPPSRDAATLPPGHPAARPAVEPGTPGAPPSYTPSVRPGQPPGQIPMPDYETAWDFNLPPQFTALPPEAETPPVAPTDRPPPVPPFVPPLPPVRPGGRQQQQTRQQQQEQANTLLRQQRENPVARPDAAGDPIAEPGQVPAPPHRGLQIDRPDRDVPVFPNGQRNGYYYDEGLQWANGQPGVTYRTADQQGIVPLFPTNGTPVGLMNWRAVELLNEIWDAMGREPNADELRASFRLNHTFRPDTRAEAAYLGLHELWSQESVYARLQGRNAARPTAAGGRGSDHGRGIAFDLQRGAAHNWLMRNLGRFNLGRVTGDDPHFVLSGARGQRVPHPFLGNAPPPGQRSELPGLQQVAAAQTPPSPRDTRGIPLESLGRPGDVGAEEPFGTLGGDVPTSLEGLSPIIAPPRNQPSGPPLWDYSPQTNVASLTRTLQRVAYQDVPDMPLPPDTVLPRGTPEWAPPNQFFPLEPEAPTGIPGDPSRGFQPPEAPWGLDPNAAPTLRGPAVVPPNQQPSVGDRIASLLNMLNPFSTAEARGARMNDDPRIQPGGGRQADAGTIQARLSEQRAGVLADVQNNPNLANLLDAVATGEVGSQGREAVLAFIETALNRVAAETAAQGRIATGRDLAQYLMNTTYFPETWGKMEGGKAFSGSVTSDLLSQAAKGSNTTGGATGNASGKVGFGGNPVTAIIGKEKFGVENYAHHNAWARDLYSPARGASSVDVSGFIPSGTAVVATPPAIQAPGLAEGGKAKKGKPYIVGEEGPELFVPDQSGTVVPQYYVPNDPKGEKTWPKAPAPDYPGRYAGIGRELMRQRRLQQDPWDPASPGSLMDLIQRDIFRLRGPEPTGTRWDKYQAPTNWERFLAAQTPSTRIEYQTNSPYF